MDIAQQIEQLNSAQQLAVTAELGNLLIIAGAGSGKTRVLINRIAWLITAQHASPHSILAVTFTNKAASEMRSRLSSMLGGGIRGIWVGTFHGLAHKLLRQHWREANLPENFQVIDSDDQLRLIKRVFKKLSIDEERWEPKKAQSFINRKKDEGIYARQLGRAESAYEQVMGEIYQNYELACQENGVLDFADLLLRSYSLLANTPDLLVHYQAKFAHFLVDEFQDTNTIQYMWLNILTQRAASVTVVGDDDQSIYGWRGAKIENIQRFSQDYVHTKVVRLEQNYRSTNTILSAANALIDNNSGRLGKTLWTQGKQGDPIIVYAALNEEDEALFVARKVQSYFNEGGNLRDIGILYRSNAQSRALEESLVRLGVPYTIYGGLRFFERAEIKDALAYVRLAVNNKDNAAFERAVNIPPRGIGKVSLDKLREFAEVKAESLLATAKEAVESKMITGKARAGLLDFIEIIAELEKIVKHSSVTEIVELTVSRSGLLAYFKEQRGEKAQSQAENLAELVSATADFVYETDETDGLDAPPILDFLAYTSLEAGDLQVDTQQAAVQLMTIHAAKGLEYPVVFICGLEEGLFPHHFSAEDPLKLEEERRLCYVGITRAMQQLYITYAQRRRLFGNEEARRVSRFVREIPSDLVEEKSRRLNVNPSYLHVPHREANSEFAQHMSSSDMGSDTGLGFNLGQRVRHAKFGMGTVVDYEGSGERARVSVYFEGVGTKWLVLSYAKLESV
jgi:DNA helicase-2/ATP-dependent DNA helicase PcrA